MIASITISGQIGAGSIITFLTTLVGFLTVRAQVKQNRTHLGEVESKVDAVNSAVNGVGDEKQPLVQNVQEIHDQLTSRTAQDDFEKAAADG